LFLSGNGEFTVNVRDRGIYACRPRGDLGFG
jgi:hypothetical protein